MGGIPGQISGDGKIDNYGGLQDATVEVADGIISIIGEGWTSQIQGVPQPDIDPTAHIYRNGEISLYSVLVKPGLMYHKITLDNMGNIQHSYTMINDIFKDGDDDITYTAIFTESFDRMYKDEYGMDVELDSHKKTDPIEIQRINLSNDNVSNISITSNSDINDLKTFLSNIENIESHESTITNKKFSELVGDNNNISHEDEYYYGTHRAEKIVDSTEFARFIWGDINIFSADARKKIN